MIDPLDYYGIAVELRDCISAELAGTVGGEPARKCIVTGTDPAIRDCCKGLLLVSLVRDYPYRIFPQESDTLFACDSAQMALELTVFMYRCASQIQSNGMALPCEAHDAMTAVVVEDAAAIKRAISCCFDTRRHSVPTTAFQTIEGVCVGSDTTVFVDTGPAACCG